MGWGTAWDNICDGTKSFFTWLWTGRGVDYQFICQKYKEDLYGKSNDYKLFKELSGVEANNLKENFDGGAGFTTEKAITSLPVLHWLCGEEYENDSFTLTSNAAGYILQEMRTWDQLDNAQKKHILKTMKNWYQKSRTNDDNNNDYLCAADRVMYYMNVGAGTSANNAISVGGFRDKIREMDFGEKPLMNYEPAYKPGFDPIKYIEELEQDIANEEKKGKTGLVSDKHPEVKEIPDELPSDNKKTPTANNTSSSQKTDDKKPSQKTMTPEERKASVEKGKEIWAKFMETEGKEMLEKLREKNAQKGVSARGLTSRLKHDSDKSGNILSDNAEEIVETKDVISISAKKER